MGTGADDVYAWHTRPGAFERLAPPWRVIRMVDRGEGIAQGSRLVFEMQLGPLRRRWVAVHRDIVPGRQFVDEQEQGPFAHWVHTHRFLAVAGGAGSTLEDVVDYALPFGALGDLLAAARVESELRDLFHHRHNRTRDDLARHRCRDGRGRLRVAVSGASGLVGGALTAFLSSGGHRIDRLVRSAPRPGSTDVRWDPIGGTIDAAGLAGTDAVVHLAGESIASGRWTSRRKRAILESRVKGTRLLAETLARLRPRPASLISASAVGIYGDRGETPVDETDRAGAGFLAEVCRQWEDATRPATDAGIRVVLLRIGIVMAARGGVLARLRAPFSLGLGGPVGTGRQYVSWIALDDLVGVIHALLFEEGIAGPVNAVSPHPVTNAGLAATLGTVLGRPAALRVPAVAVSIALGEMGREALLAGARVRPSRLEALGFPYLQPRLEGAIRAELGAFGSAL